jgi:hypothetical protein
MYVLIMSLVRTLEQLAPDAIRPEGGAAAAGGDADNDSSLSDAFILSKFSPVKPSMQELRARRFFVAPDHTLVHLRLSIAQPRRESHPAPPCPLPPRSSPSRPLLPQPKLHEHIPSAPCQARGGYTVQ